MNKQQKKILVAEDEVDLREALETVLSDEGYEVLCVSDGEEAFNAYQTESPDLLILDLNMPKKGGMEVLCEIRSDLQDERTPIVILTASVDLDHIADATAIGGMKTDFLSKADKSLAQIVAHIGQRLGE